MNMLVSAIPGAKMGKTRRVIETGIVMMPAISSSLLPADASHTTFENTTGATSVYRAQKKFAMCAALPAAFLSPFCVQVDCIPDWTPHRQMKNTIKAMIPPLYANAVSSRPVGPPPDKHPSGSSVGKSKLITLPS